MIEGVHFLTIRPAQGELGELVLNVPPPTTISDVLDPARTPTPGAQPPEMPSLVSLWRFDPDTRKLRVSLTRPVPPVRVAGQIADRHRAHAVRAGGRAPERGGRRRPNGFVRSRHRQRNTARYGDSDGPLAGQSRRFPAEVTAQQPGTTVRRAFRYAETTASALIKASAVEPDVRVDTQDTISLGEDRTVLAATPTVEITRAGIFRLSFVMPAGFDVESVSGPSLSHWTELKADAGRVITLHLKGKTEGQTAVRYQSRRAGHQSHQRLGRPSIEFPGSCQAARLHPAGP